MTDNFQQIPEVVCSTSPVVCKEKTEPEPKKAIVIGSNTVALRSRPGDSGFVVTLLDPGDAIMLMKQVGDYYEAVLYYERTVFGYIPSFLCQVKGE